MLLLSLTACIAIAGYLAWSWQRDERLSFLPGETTHGHYQIELACDACHSPFQGVTQDACVECHGEELEIADDSHPKSKFTDPRNADRVERLDARECITCHVEHRPAFTRAMGVTQPDDYCFHCHEDIADERPSHKGMAFDTCLSAGCHNFHDNRGLHEDFLEKHLDAPRMAEEPRLPLRFEDRPAPDKVALTRAQADAPSGVKAEAEVFSEWEASAHARAGVNCRGCHVPEDAGEEVADERGWVARPSFKVCKECHEDPVKGFLSGHHGMRLAQDLGPMHPREARLPMKAEAADRELGCGSCHGAHRYDRLHAAADACVECHDDRHTRAYEESVHAQLWRSEQAGEAPEGTGVSCATCHLPRMKLPGKRGAGAFRVEHNQNDNLRPNEKMIRSVCDTCHGVPFVIDALADRALVDRNFQGAPAVHIESIDMVKNKLSHASRANP